MKVTIIGPGAIGLLLASSLEKYNDVSVLVKDKHYEILIQKGLWIKNGKKKKTIKANIVKDVKEADIVIIAVKSYDLESTKEVLKDFKGKIMVCQNGLKMLEYNPKNGNDLFSIVTSVGAVSLELGITEFKGTGTTVIGNLNGDEGEILDTETLFSDEYFEINAVTNIIEYIWLKAVINSAVNPIAALYNLKNGELRDSKYWTLVEELLNESMNIAKENNISFSYNPLEETKIIINKTPDNLCSMLQDLRKGQRTEIEEINGILVRFGRKNNLDTYFNQKYLDKIIAIS